MSRRKIYKIKVLWSFLLILLGLVLVVIWLPYWVWFVLLGLISIVIGINVYFK